ncbi:MAG: YihY family inner membrane protein [Pseudodesulfovibrio sp.]|uniref:Ribonuclease BN n=1 Tax=Pseudodesulfovibrio aespoeensis (strain ATCC 700646 / DSM 10631 / Aspo-2) TaxID=643562 RepID=E6VVX6_PSEA9|nr:MULTISPECIES: YhjD/YihY/BrkB family envelope integrity protein [Pseudodesulfovibrio]MBU4473914.1 YihY family inner membrane protein [Pseudomonadota bacterium]ADU62421.1 ribonuclease BN [Pseudodesulfovibrio aespoeensis Aspo-2]MBU4515112.1 YihY family inner membrane protein [Pseudomonadota bacterium]MBU4521017.1 YihY family inner membrane protein [Pseudomonadota bacterium]MBU4559223.1 YihY family inner membrane protein [Pseudomonadota bacterium]
MTREDIERRARDLKRHFSEGIWMRNVSETPLVVRLWRSVSRLFYLVVFGFAKDQCIIRAAALTFTTILSIVPFLAVAFSISKGFGLQNTEFIRTLVLKLTTGREEVADKIIEYIDRTNVQALGWVGVATLLFTVLSLVGTIEKAFNTIWGVTKGRSAWRKVTDFFPVIVICPMVLLIASSFNLSLQQQEIVTGLLSVKAIGLLEAAFLKATPYILISMAFAFMYAFIPHTKVRLTSAVLGGVVGGVLWQMAQWLYIHWQIGAAKYNAIYGSFAQLPLLLMWIYISWLVVLLGCEVSYAWQNLNTFVKQRYFGQATPFERQKIAVLMMSLLARRFRDGRPLPSVEEISDGLMAPASLVSDLFRLLQKAGYTVLTDDQDHEVYAPARALDEIRVLDVVRVVNMDADNRVFREFAEKFTFIEDLFRQLGRDALTSPANLTLLECAAEYPDIISGDQSGDRSGKAGQIATPTGAEVIG